jgi:hypothetical protein
MMSDSKKDLPEWELSEDAGGIHTGGGPDALSAGAWGTFEPVMADLELYLANLEYPVSKEQLVEHVRRQGAPEFMVLTLEQLPQEEFESAADITLGLGEVE